jgi:hypothetical protein
MLEFVMAAISRYRRGLSSLTAVSDTRQRVRSKPSLVKLKGRAKAALAFVISGGSLTADPVVNVLLHAILGIAIPSLDFAFELLSVAVNLS